MRGSDDPRLIRIGVAPQIGEWADGGERGRGEKPALTAGGDSAPALRAIPAGGAGTTGPTTATRTVSTSANRRFFGSGGLREEPGEESSPASAGGPEAGLNAFPKRPTTTACVTTARLMVIARPSTRRRGFIYRRPATFSRLAFSTTLATARTMERMAEGDESRRR